MKCAVDLPVSVESALERGIEAFLFEERSFSRRVQMPPEWRGTDGAKAGERRFAYFLDEEKVRRLPVRTTGKSTLQK